MQKLLCSFYVKYYVKNFYWYYINSHTFEIALVKLNMAILLGTHYIDHNDLFFH